MPVFLSSLHSSGNVSLPWSDTGTRVTRKNPRRSNLLFLLTEHGPFGLCVTFNTQLLLTVPADYRFGFRLGAIQTDHQGSWVGLQQCCHHNPAGNSILPTYVMASLLACSPWMGLDRSVDIIFPFRGKYLSCNTTFYFEAWDVLTFIS